MPPQHQPVLISRRVGRGFGGGDAHQFKSQAAGFRFYEPGKGHCGLFYNDQDPEFLPEGETLGVPQTEHTLICAGVLGCGKGNRDLHIAVRCDDIREVYWPDLGPTCGAENIIVAKYKCITLVPGARAKVSEPPGLAHLFAGRGFIAVRVIYVGNVFHVIAADL